MKSKKLKEQLPFPKILTKILKDKRITLAEAAKGCGVSTSTISDWCNGISPQELMAVKRLSKFLNVSFSYLLTGENEDSENSLTSNLGELFEEGPELYEGYAQIIIKKLIPKK